MTVIFGREIPGDFGKFCAKALASRHLKQQASQTADSTAADRGGDSCGRSHFQRPRKGQGNGQDDV
jgi:hypothetical protein